MKTVSPHPNLIEYIGDCVATVGDVQTFYILMELCSVQLSQIISDRNSNPWSEAEVLNIFSQVNGSANLLAGLIAVCPGLLWCPATAPQFATAHCTSVPTKPFIYTIRFKKAVEHLIRSCVRLALIPACSKL